MIRFLTRISCLLAALLIFTDALAQDQFTLRVKLKEGDSYKYHFNATQQINQVIMGNAVDMTQKMGMRLRNDVVDVNDRGYEIKITYERVSISQQGPMGAQGYDSDATSDPDTINPMFLGFAAMVDMNLIVKMDRLGKVYEIEGTEAMLDAMIAKYADQGIPTDEMREMLEVQFNDESMQHEMERLMTVFPEHALKIGDSWTHSGTGQTAMFPMSMDNTYTLIEEKNGKLKIDIDSDIKSADLDPAAQQGMNMIVEINGSQTGTLLLDQATGIPDQFDFNQSINGQITMDDPTGGDTPMTWPITMETSNTLKVSFD